MINGLIREGLQTLPIVGTIITNMKTVTKESPDCKIKLQGWDFYRLIIGVGVGYVLMKGLLTVKELGFVLDAIGI